MITHKCFSGIQGTDRNGCWTCKVAISSSRMLCYYGGYCELLHRSTKGQYKLVGIRLKLSLQGICRLKCFCREMSLPKYVVLGKVSIFFLGSWGIIYFAQYNYTYTHTHRLLALRYKTECSLQTASTGLDADITCHAQIPNYLWP